MDYKIIDELYWHWIASDEHEKTPEYARVAKYQQQAETLVQSLTENKQVLIAISDSIGYVGSEYAHYAFFSGFEMAVKLMDELRSCLLK